MNKVLGSRNTYAETNISAKFDVIIRDVNVWLIFDHNSPD